MADLILYSIMLNGHRAIQHTPHYSPLATIPKLALVSLPPIHFGLTEKNLLQISRHYSPALLPPSLTLLLALDLVLLLPRMLTPEPKRPEELAPDHLKKRRQRMGPLCDSCRLRKVKCNAEVSMLGLVDESRDLPCDLTRDEQSALLAGELVPRAGHGLVLSNGKLIKFKACLLCNTKGLRCCFSKGFTKEDMVNLKRAQEPFEKKGRVCKRSEAATRKSSCAACRRRKVKCVMNSRANKCVGCLKKDSLCLFE